MYNLFSVKTYANMEKIVVDARMIYHSGIGVYLRSIIERLMNIGKFKILLLVYRQNIGIYGTKVEYVLVKSEIYSLRELFEIPFKIPRCNVFWTPHFNSPVFPTKAKRRLTTIHDVYHLAHLKKFSFLERMVIPRSRSRSLESRTQVGTASPSRKMPDCSSRESTRVVLPWSTWAMIATLRMGRLMGLEIPELEAVVMFRKKP